MPDESVKLIEKLEAARKEIARTCYPDFQEQLLYTLERRHLDVPAITDALPCPEAGGTADLKLFLSDNVRLLEVEEIAYDADEEIHLPGIECALSAMRGLGVSLVFLVRGMRDRVHVYMGIANFTPEARSKASFNIDAFKSTLTANFPGTKLHNTDNEAIYQIATDISNCPHIGVLCGIPSLKREEDRNIFVQGIERLIRSMRGKEYMWMSVADPISDADTMKSLDACRSMQSNIHHLVKTQLSEAVSSGKTVQMGLFGMKGSNVSDSIGHSAGGSTSDTSGKSHTQNKLNASQRIAGGISSILTIAGSTLGPVGSILGNFLGSAVQSLAGAITGDNGYSDTTSESHTDTQTWSDTTTHGVAQQLAGGGFGSVGLSWTRTTTVGQELLNRKIQYAEELLQKYETRLQEGLALGMWNLGHYLCTQDESTYRQGCGVINSLFTGMDSTYEPPRAIRLPKHCAGALQKFSNIYLLFSSVNWNAANMEQSARGMVNHPLGIMFNGPASPVNTRELAIVSPFASQDVEGITVTRRASFGVNIPRTAHMNDVPQVPLGKVMDKGDVLEQKVRLDISLLKKHMAVFGLTGSGKTNTIHHLLVKLWKKHRIPFMVIEPAKAEYRALAACDELKDELLVITAGAERGASCPLRLNPFSFSPGEDRDSNRIHVLTHIDKLKATFNASFPMYASMPYILEEAILEVYRERGWDLGRSENLYVNIYREDFSDYLPTLYDLYLKVDAIVSSKGYFQEQQMNIQAALKARLASLMVGAKGCMFNCAKSIPDEDLWERPVVVELENMGDDDEKAFLMGLLVSRLYEYRKASYKAEAARADAPCHILVIEEAHRLLPNIPEAANSMESANAKAKAVSSFVDMLSEVRALGQSVVVVDQLPSRINPNIVKGTATKVVHRLLSKDDRNAVGCTMGLLPSQIDDLGMLRVGECVVNQEGITSSFLCKIPRVDVHESRTGDECSPFTWRYVHEHAGLLVSSGDLVKHEDERIWNAVCEVMLAIGCGQPTGDLQTVMARVAPASHVEETFRYYWDNVTHALWGYYRGSFRAFKAMQKSGFQLLGELDAAEAYRAAFGAYFKGTKAYMFSTDGSLEGVSFLMLCERRKLLQHIDRYYDMVKNAVDSAHRMAQAITRALPLLEMPGATLHPSILDAVLRSRLRGIADESTIEAIIRCIHAQ